MLQRQITEERDIRLRRFVHFAQYLAMSTWKACSGSAAVMKQLCLNIWLPSAKVKTGCIQRSTLSHISFLYPSSACKMDSRILKTGGFQRSLTEKLPWLYQEVAHKGHLQTRYISWQPKRMPFSLGWRHHLFPLVKVYKNFQIYFRNGDYTSIISMLSRTCV